jgi:methyl-accepting chemotaxis protein
MSDDMTAAACAAQLRKLAEDDRFAKRADDLKSLATDVERADGDAWAGVDLFAAFPSDTGTASSHPNWVERLLGIASGAAVFAPVAWTWWSFRDASRAYRTMLSEGTEADGTSFLSLWATGFDGNLSGSHLLVPMAGRSLVLIILAIALVVAHRITAEFNVRREEQVAKESRHELVSALTLAQRIMNQRRADHPQRIEGIIKSSMQKLQMAHDATRVAVIDLTDSSKQITKDMTKLVKAAREAGEESRRLTESAATAGSNLQSMSQETKEAVAAAMSSLEGTVQSSLTTTHQSLTAASDSLNSSLQGTLNEFQSTMGSRLQDFTSQAVGALESASSQLNATVAQIGDSSESNAASARALTEQVQALADDRATSSDDFTRAVADIRSTLESLEEALTRHESTMQGQASELTGARDAAERMLRVLTPNGAGPRPPAVTVDA